MEGCVGGTSAPTGGASATKSLGQSTGVSNTTVIIIPGPTNALKEELLDTKKPSQGLILRRGDGLGCWPSVTQRLRMNEIEGKLTMGRTHFSKLHNPTDDRELERYIIMGGLQSLWTYHRKLSFFELLNLVMEIYSATPWGPVSETTDKDFMDKL